MQLKLELHLHVLRAYNIPACRQDKTRSILTQATRPNEKQRIITFCAIRARPWAGFAISAAVAACGSCCVEILPRPTSYAARIRRFIGHAWALTGRRIISSIWAGETIIGLGTTSLTVCRACNCNTVPWGWRGRVILRITIASRRTHPPIWTTHTIVCFSSASFALRRAA